MTFCDFHVFVITWFANWVNRGPHVKPMPVSQPLPATLCTHRQWKPIDIMLRLAAVCTTVEGESTIIETTSTPLSASALTASASLAGSTQASSTMSCVVALGLTDLAPSSNALTDVRMLGIGYPITQPSLLVLVDLPATTPIRYSY